MPKVTHNVKFYRVLLVLWWISLAAVSSSKLQPGYFSKIKTKEYKNKLVEINHFINDNRKTMKLQIIHT